uniref:Secretory carrier membrane protein 3 n=1 Tax=Homo sapiens TaxID=9606 RepID=A0AAQ5BHQ3_HUMAN
MAQSRDGGNPFAEPSELDNPFQVTCASRPLLGGQVDSSRFCRVGLTCIPICDI